MKHAPVGHQLSMVSQTNFCCPAPLAPFFQPLAMRLDTWLGPIRRLLVGPSQLGVAVHQEAGFRCPRTANNKTVGGWAKDRVSRIYPGQCLTGCVGQNVGHPVECRGCRNCFSEANLRDVALGSPVPSSFLGKL